MALCLGQEDGVELRGLLRTTITDEPIAQAILAGVAHKPRGHHFSTEIVPARLPASRTCRMNRTGG
jgi:cyclic pyranopterin phosphate synthase